MDLAALLISIVALLVSCASVFFAKQQADASKAQAAAAAKALELETDWREKAEQRANPQFRVVATQLIDLQIGYQEGEFVSRGESFLKSVDVLIENISSLYATINHVGIENQESGSITKFDGHDFEIDLPRRMAPGEQIHFSIPGSEFFLLLDDSLPEEAEFVVFVSKSHFLERGSTVERWDSQSFSVQRPPEGLEDSVQ